jgi:hypothetical protein
MDAKLKKMIDDFFKKHEGNAICLEMYGNIDYGDRARQCYWEEHIEEFSHEMTFKDNYGEYKMDKIVFANLGLSDEDIPSSEVAEVGDIAGAVFNILPWETSDFDGEVNQYWYGLVVVTNDYKVLRVTSTGEYDVLYRSTIGDLTKFGSEDEELEKRAIKSIKSSIGNIKAKFKEIQTEEGKVKALQLLDKLNAYMLIGKTENVNDT